ncbi:TPA: hypothetical protein N0F65_002866 [Lagenidium giganteum]|uniref:Alpha-1,3-glucosyltransferase n=1 Tax=Lagenidium giganteum TaxID=4803 RepID=A0AAV2Z936_9STRA|nr:TPA: hypothetical protein N0F65_002866 [Lagenidium giganteum]
MAKPKAVATSYAADTAAPCKSVVERVMAHFEEHDLKMHGALLVWLVLLLVRWMVGLHSYSGAHTPPMFGDYEAQRHWMEITLHVPLSNWYFNTTTNDLLYWGLDYPPLTAYVSYVCGWLFHRVEPDMVALTTSRGYETPTSKVLMRLSVIACDALLFFPAIWLVARWVHRQQWTKQTSFVLLVLLQPSLLLIDHGHFQYNNVCLGFTALAVALILRGHEFLGSISYCLALNFKQMALYYAPAFGVFLLARCIYRPNFVVHIIKLAVAVVATFALLWAPFCLVVAKDQTCLSSIGQVLHRIFPFARGLFEDKVANVWCVLDLVVKIKRHVTPVTQMRLCTLATLVGFLPSVIDLLRRKPTPLRFVLALANASLSFFLFSFQVHEKSILLPLLPVSLLFGHISLISGWFSVISTFSMYFLLQKDGLTVPYIALQIFYCAVAIYPFLSSSSHLQPSARVHTPGFDGNGAPHWLLRIAVVLSLCGALACHAAHVLVTPPARYPHIHDYLVATYSCGHFVLMLFYCTYWQWTVLEPDSAVPTKQLQQKKRQ